MLSLKPIKLKAMRKILLSTMLCVFGLLGTLMAQTNITHRLESIENYATISYKYDEGYPNRVVAIDDAGMFTELTYNEAGQLRKSMVYANDEKGRPTEEILVEVEYIYNDNGLLMATKETSNMFMTTVVVRNYSYNEEGKLLEVSIDDMEYSINYSYNEEGLLSEKLIEDSYFQTKEVYSYDTENRLVYKGCYFYNGEGELMSDLTEETTYEYDENGNCVLEKTSTQDTETMTITRVTEYYYDVTISKENVYIFEDPQQATLYPARPSSVNILVKEFSYLTLYDSAVEETVEESHKVTAYRYNPAVEMLPFAPILRAEVVGKTIKLSWSKYADAETYTIYKDGEMFVEGVKGSTFSCVSFASAESCFTVVAVNGAGESEHSNEVCVSVGEGVAEKEAAFNIYPNPVKDKLYIETETVINEVSIFDIYGRKQLAVSGQQSAVSVANLNSGVYFVKVFTNDGEVVKRFVKK